MVLPAERMGEFVEVMPPMKRVHEIGIWYG
jgi:hypothetical protein